MQQNNEKELKLAVLIDADNVSYQYVRPMMEEIAIYGIPTVKRIYGDWTRQNMNGWKAQLLDYAISPIQQFNYTTGKNSTDSALIIDAMDILYTDDVDGFCLISSDSDFTKLAIRIRESGKLVLGFGEQKTPNAFIAACNRFLYLEILEDNYEETEPLGNTNRLDGVIEPTTTPKKNNAQVLRTLDNAAMRMIQNSIDAIADDQGWAFLADVGNVISKTEPSFDSRNYGYSKLSHLVEDMDEVEIDERTTNNPNVKHVFVRNSKKSRNKSKIRRY